MVKKINHSLKNINRLELFVFFEQKIRTQELASRVELSFQVGGVIHKREELASQFLSLQRKFIGCDVLKESFSNLDPLPTCMQRRYDRM